MSTDEQTTVTPKLSPVKSGDYTLLDVTVNGVWIGRIHRRSRPTAKIGAGYYYTAKVHARVVTRCPRDRRADAGADLVANYNAHPSAFH